MALVGDPTFAADIEQWRQKPMVRLVQTTAQTGIAHDTPTAVTFANTEDYDTLGWHDLVTNNTRITIGSGWSGYYDIRGGVHFAARNDWRLLFCYIRINGSTQVPPGGRITPYFLATAYGQSINTNVKIALNAGDYVELIAQAINTAAASFSLSSGGAQASVLELTYDRPL